MKRLRLRKHRTCLKNWHAMTCYSDVRWRRGPPPNFTVSRCFQAVVFNIWKYHKKWQPTNGSTNIKKLRANHLVTWGACDSKNCGLKNKADSNSSKKPIAVWYTKIDKYRFAQVVNKNKHKCGHCFVALALHESVWIIREEVVWYWGHNTALDNGTSLPAGFG